MASHRVVATALIVALLPGRAMGYAASQVYGWKWPDGRKYSEYGKDDAECKKQARQVIRPVHGPPRWYEDLPTLDLGLAGIPIWIYWELTLGEDREREVTSYKACMVEKGYVPPAQVQAVEPDPALNPSGMGGSDKSDRTKREREHAETAEGPGDR